MGISTEGYSINQCSANGYVSQLKLLEGNVGTLIADNVGIVTVELDH